MPDDHKQELWDRDCLAEIPALKFFFFPCMTLDKCSPLCLSFYRLRNEVYKNNPSHWVLRTKGFYVLKGLRAVSAKEQCSWSCHCS